jgi:hypothetical protein
MIKAFLLLYHHCYLGPLNDLVMSQSLTTYLLEMTYIHDAKNIKNQLKSNLTVKSPHIITNVHKFKNKI